MKDEIIKNEPFDFIIFLCIFLSKKYILFLMGILLSVLIMGFYTLIYQQYKSQNYIRIIIMKFQILTLTLLKR
jgi:hypothetical protein